jgi:hypothetical protein
MMKKLSYAMIVIMLLFVILSCQNKAPAGPAQPTGTDTVTFTITPTFSITETFTDTPSFTATPTFTATVTSTSTPPDLVIDDFEDGNLVNAISYWGANSMLGNTIHYQNLITPPPGNGTHAFAVTATVNVAAGDTYTYIIAGTGPTGSATPVDVRQYNKIRFGRLLNGTLYGGIKSFSVSFTDDANTVTYGTGAQFSVVFEEWELGLRQSYSLSGGSLEDLLANVKQIYFTFYVNGVPGDSADVALVIDDLRFTHN